MKEDTKYVVYRDLLFKLYLRYRDKNICTFLMKTIFVISGMLKDSSGRYTKQHIDRAGKISGPLGKELDKLFAQNIAHTYVASTRGTETKEQSQAPLVEKFVKVYKGDKLVQNVRKRAYDLFPSFEYSMDIKFPEKLKEGLLRHSARIDKLSEEQTLYDPASLDDFDDTPLAEIDQSSKTDYDDQCNLDDISLSELDFV